MLYTAQLENTELRALAVVLSSSSLVLLRNDHTAILNFSANNDVGRLRSTGHKASRESLAAIAKLGRGLMGVVMCKTLLAPVARDRHDMSVGVPVLAHRVMAAARVLWLV